MNAGTLKLLLHMYCHPPEVRYVFDGNPQFLRDCRHTLWLANLIDREDELGIITDRGRTHVEALLDAPLPEQRWVSPLPDRWPTMDDVTGISDLMRGAQP